MVVLSPLTAVGDVSTKLSVPAVMFWLLWVDVVHWA